MRKIKVGGVFKGENIFDIDDEGNLIGKSEFSAIPTKAKEENNEASKVTRSKQQKGYF